MKKIIIFRHGQTDWNVQGIIQGHIDIPLNAEGKAQAEILGSKLKEAGIQHIYSSDLQRAYQTAHIVSTHIQCAITPMQELRELHSGVAQGKSRTESSEHPVIVHWASRDSIHDMHCFEGGETKKQVQERAQRALDTIFTTTNHDIVAISAHRAIITQLLLLLIKDPTITIERLENAEHVVLHKSHNDWIF